jgi:hypothetical protein
VVQENFVRMSDETQSQSDFSTITALIRKVVDQSKGDAIAQLRVLRFLEHLHQDIRESEFQPALPTDRHGLNNLLKEMEAQGGWPYIPKMNLRALLSYELYENIPADTLESKQPD